MNITENLQRIKQGKDDIITALQNKGSDIKNETLINEISNYVEKLEIGGGDTPVQPDVPELVQKYEGASVFRINVPTDNYEFSINLCNDASKATYDVDWGDGNLESGLTTDEQHHTYSKAGIYDVNVYNLSKDITLGGNFIDTYRVNNTEYFRKSIYFLFNNSSNDFWSGTYIENKEYVICTNILIGKGIYTFGDSAFKGCTSLQSIVIPEGVTSIGDSAFKGCTSLQSIVIPEGVTSIGSYAFTGCTSLQSIVIPNSVTSIGSDAFSSCASLQSIVIPEGVTSIGYSAFSSCASLQSIVIPEGVTSIGDSAFKGCTSLQSIVIPNSVTSIGSDAFSSCVSLQSIVIPEGVTSIGSYAFDGCTSLQSIVIPETIKSIGSYAFNKCTSLQSIVIPEGVTSIGSYAFSSCASLQSIVIPEGVTSIGYNAFYGCTSLQSIVIPEGVTSIGSYAFSSCISLQSIVIPEGVTSIGSYAFYRCTSLQSIVIPEGVTSIGSYAFNDCFSLQEIICNGLTAPTITSNSFPTSNLKYTKRYLYIPKESTGYDSGNFKTYLIDKGWELRYIEDRVKTPTTLKLKTKNNFFHNLQAIGQANLVDYELIDNEYIYHFDDKIPELAQYTFYNKVLEDIELPEGLEIIGNNTFQTCSSLQSIVIPDSVTTIGIHAFKGCASLQSIVIPETIKSIESYTFSGCYSLQSIVIPDSVTTIGNYGFQSCIKLSTITCKAMTAPTIQNYTFQNIGNSVSSGTRVLRVPEGAVGYNEGYWKSTVVDYGYTLEYVPLSEL